MEEEYTEQDHQRTLIEFISKEHEFEEIYDLKESSNEAEEIQIKTIKRGVFKSEDNYLGIICKFVNYQVLKPELSEFLNNRIEIEKTYEGEKYLLCITKSKIYSYNIDLYNKIISMIDEVDLQIQMDSITLKIGISEKSNNHILIIETDIADFLISGLIEDNQEEVERVILSNKLESSQPFFEFKAPIHFNWQNLLGDKDRQFERICELLLQKESNIISIIPIGKTRAADRGRDFEVVEELGVLNSNSQLKWLVQCKYSDRSISPSSIAGWTDRIIEHKYDGYWLMTNNDITPSLFDQFKDIEANEAYQVKTQFWQRSDFHIKLNVHSELFIKNDIFKLE